MARFNPFAHVSGRYGAPMGRHGSDASTYDGESKLYARHMGGDGYYDRGGAYWGHSRVYAVWTRGGHWCAYVEAGSEWEAIDTVRYHSDPQTSECEEAATAAGWVNENAKASEDRPLLGNWRNRSPKTDGYSFRLAKDVCEEFGLGPCAQLGEAA